MVSPARREFRAAMDAFNNATEAELVPAWERVKRAAQACQQELRSVEP